MKNPFSFVNTVVVFLIACQGFGQVSAADKVTDIVMDQKTKLMWQRGTIRGIDHGSAVAYCKKLELAGKTDWRLPTDKELGVALGSKELLHEIGYEGGNFFLWSSTKTPRGNVMVSLRNRNTNASFERSGTWKPAGSDSVGAKCVSDSK